ncbi:MAG: L-histidine N(alpha)-methyltransferase, partial [Acidimicrobiales bacterium]
MQPSCPGNVLEVHLDDANLLERLANDTRAGLTSRPKVLAPKWLYDERGCDLFDEITRLPEYYPTRRERAILIGAADEIADLSGADTLVELGSGTSDKTRVLLDALSKAGSLRRYVPFDVSEPTLRGASKLISDAYPQTQVHAVVGDFEQHLGLLPKGGCRLVAFLGSTIGNLDPTQRHSLLSELADGLGNKDWLLLGTDLVKDPTRLVAAYNDGAGVTAEFNLNVLRVLNEALGADFHPGSFSHVAVWNEAHERMEMRLRSKDDQTVTLSALDLVVDFEDGEEMRTEISTKFRREGLRDEMSRAGLVLGRWWTDADEDYGVSLWRRPAGKLRSAT